MTRAGTVWRIEIISSSDFTRTSCWRNSDAHKEFFCYTVCMDIRFTKHAKERMRERSITEEDIHRALALPDRVDRSIVSAVRFVAKKVYYNTHLAEKHLLMVICEEEDEAILIVTIIDTSKIEKYF